MYVAFFRYNPQNVGMEGEENVGRLSTQVKSLLRLGSCYLGSIISDSSSGLVTWGINPKP